LDVYGQPSNSRASLTATTLLKICLSYAPCIAGATYFLLKAAPSSASGRRKLLDAYGYHASTWSAK
jgi:hypothetical protein